MVQTIVISEKTTLKSLRENFGLERTDEADFSQEWQGDQYSPSDTEHQILTRIGDRVYLSRKRSPVVFSLLPFLYLLTFFVNTTTTSLG